MFNYQCLDRTSHSCSSRNGFHGGQGREYATQFSGVDRTAIEVEVQERGGNIAGKRIGGVYRTVHIQVARRRTQVNFVERDVASLCRQLSTQQGDFHVRIDKPGLEIERLDGFCFRRYVDRQPGVDILHRGIAPVEQNIRRGGGCRLCANASVYDVYEAGPEGPDARTRPGRIGKRPENLGDIPGA